MSPNRVSAHGHSQVTYGYDGSGSSSYDRHRAIDVAHHRSLSDQIPKPVRQFQVVGLTSPNDQLLSIRDSSSAPLSILSSSSLSGGYVIQQQKPPNSHSSPKVTIPGSVLRPALMRMAAANPEASRAFRSTVQGQSSASVIGSVAQSVTSPAAPGKVLLRPTSARATGSNAPDLASHYRTIQPKPVGMAVRGPHFGSPLSAHVDARSLSVNPANIKISTSMMSHVPHKTSAAAAVSRPSHSTPAMSPSFAQMSGARRPGIGAPLSVQSSVLNVPRVPVAAHVSPKTAPLPPSSLPPPPYAVHHSPHVSPLPPPPYRSTSELMPAASTVSRTSSAMSMSSFNAACSRSAHHVVSSAPRYSVDTFDQMPLDCSRKNSVSAADNNASDIDYVLNLTTSGNQSKVDSHQSEVIEVPRASSSRKWMDRDVIHCRPEMANWKT
jgi:hypothetical protein